MKKINWIVLIALAAFAVLLLILWYYLGYSQIDNPLDLVLSLVWFAVIVVVALLIALAENKRRAQIRTVYVSPTALFNSERGMVGLKGVDRVDAIQSVLEDLKYGFDKKELPSAKKFDYQYVVQTDEFKQRGEEEIYGADAQASASARDGAETASAAGSAAATGKSAEAAASNAQKAPEASDGAKEPKWTGTVIKLDRENGNVETKFNGIAELRAALA
jgi:hypothetical protein